MSLLILFDSGEPTSLIEEIDVYSRKLVRVLFTDEIVVDEEFNNPDNYTIAVVQGEGPIEVVGVLPTNKTASLEVILVTQPMTEETIYSISISNLSNRTGSSVSPSGNFVARETKVDSIMRSIPKHFDKRPTSIISSLLTIIGRSDDIIGGSQNELV